MPHPNDINYDLISSFLKFMFDRSYTLLLLDPDYGEHRTYTSITPAVDALHGEDLPNMRWMHDDNLRHPWMMMNPWDEDGNFIIDYSVNNETFDMHVESWLGKESS